VIRAAFFSAVYLLAALLLEVAILPELEPLVGASYRFFFMLRLLAMTGILVGLLRGETSGMLAGLTAAILMSMALGPGWLGASLVSFTTVGYLAGLLARHFRLTGFFFRWFSIGFLLVVERLVFAGVKWTVGHGGDLAFSWLALALTALIGAALYRWLAPRLKIHLFFADVE
jgi:hypothetical protein